MTTPDPAKLRVGDAEREDAMRVLGEHMAGGRLDLDEYGERTALVTTARTWGDITALFADLPEPHPTFAAADAASASRTEPTPPRARSARAEALRTRFPTMSLAGRIAGGAVIAAAIFAFGLFLLTVLPMILVAGLVIWMLAGTASHGRWNNQWNGQMHAARRRARAEYYRCRRGW